MTTTTAEPTRYSEALAQSDKAIVRRLPAPTPDQVRAARKKAELTQGQAAELVQETGKYLYCTWQSYEMPAATSGHRDIPRGVWELFLLLIDQHPDPVLARKDPPATSVA